MSLSRNATGRESHRHGPAAARVTSYLCSVVILCLDGTVVMFYKLLKSEKKTERKRMFRAFIEPLSICDIVVDIDAQAACDSSDTW